VAQDVGIGVGGELDVFDAGPVAAVVEIPEILVAEGEFAAGGELGDGADIEEGAGHGGGRGTERERRDERRGAEGREPGSRDRHADPGGNAGA